MSLLSNGESKTYLVYYVNTNTNSVLHVEVLLHDDIQTFINTREELAIAEDLAKHLSDNGANARLFCEVITYKPVGQMQLSVMHVNKEGNRTELTKTPKIDAMMQSITGMTDKEPTKH